MFVLKSTQEESLQKAMHFRMDEANNCKWSAAEARSLCLQILVKAQCKISRYSGSYVEEGWKGER